MAHKTAYNLSKFKKGDVVKVKKGRQTSKEMWVNRIVTAEVMVTNKRSWADRSPIIKLKLLGPSTARTKWGYRWEKGTLLVYEDCLELVYQGEPDYSIY